MHGFKFLENFSPAQGTYPCLLLYLAFSLVILAEYMRCRRYHTWLSKHPYDRETVQAKIVLLWTLPTRARLLVKYTTLKGLTLYKDVVRDVLYYAVNGFKKGNTVEVTYRRSHPDTVFLEPFGQDKLKGVARGLIVMPALFAVLTAYMGFFVVENNFHVFQAAMG